jgi:hypothetical protein
MMCEIWRPEWRSRYSDSFTNWVVRGSNSCGAIYSMPSSQVPRPPSLLYSGYLVSVPGLKRPENGDDRPPPCSIGLRMCRNYTSAYILCLYRHIMGWPLPLLVNYCIESRWNVIAHDDGREGKWRGNWRMEWVSSTLHTTLEHGVSSITNADAHTSAASSGTNWNPCRFKWTRPFRRKAKSGFCACHHISNAVYQQLHMHR